MTRRAAQRASLVAFGVVLALVALEGVARFATETREGRPYLLGTELLPRVTTTDEQRTWLALSRSPDDLPYYVPDPELGWTIKPNGRIWNDLHVANGQGLRAPRELPAEKPPGVRRVLLAGDSFTHGDEIVFEDTWGSRLEEALGPGWEVWNAAVSGYGTDQALLRWRRYAPRVRPDVAILGIYREDLLRNLGIFRPVKHPGTGFPFSKPRFVREGEALRLANSPVVPPEEVPETLAGFADSPLRELDALWRRELHEDRWWYRSRIARYLASRALVADERRRREALLRAEGEGTLTTAAIAAQLAADARAAGAEPIVVLLPDAEDLAAYAPGGSPPLAPLAARLAAAGVTVVDVGPALRADLAAGESPTALFTRQDRKGHPNARAARVIARELARAIAPEPGAGPLHRGEPRRYEGERSPR